MAMEIRLL